MELKDKICIVTGAARGIGQAIALEFIDQGAEVYGFDLTEGSLKRLEEENPRFHAVYADITDREAVKSSFLEIKKTAGRIDVLVNNAGIVQNNRLGMIARDQTEKMFLVNVIALMELTQLAARVMSRQGGGSIVNMASITGVVGSPGQSAYAATKGAVIAFTKSAAKELAPMNVRVNAVAPGIVKTERFEELYESDGTKIDTRIDKIGLGRLGSPEDVAKACAFLASDDSSYISGQVLGVDGCAMI